MSDEWIHSVQENLSFQKMCFSNFCELLGDEGRPVKYSCTFGVLSTSQLAHASQRGWAYEDDWPTAVLTFHVWAVNVAEVTAVTRVIGWHA